MYFKPRGIPLIELEQVTLTLDEVEALRLADLEALYQAEAAQKMKVSRATFARIVEQARRKVAEALIHGKAICMEGGSVVLKGMNTMPKGDGTGPAPGGQGMGRGMCRCGQRHGARRSGCCGGKANPGQVCCSTKTASVCKQKKGK